MESLRSGLRQTRRCWRANPATRLTRSSTRSAMARRRGIACRTKRRVALQALQARKVRKVRKDHKARRVRKDPKARKANRDRRAYKVCRAWQVLRARMERRELPVR